LPSFQEDYPGLRGLGLLPLEKNFYLLVTLQISRNCFSMELKSWVEAIRCQSTEEITDIHEKGGDRKV
jgi:hypothetical protein